MGDRGQPSAPGSPQAQAGKRLRSTARRAVDCRPAARCDVHAEHGHHHGAASGRRRSTPCSLSSTAVITRSSASAACSSSATRLKRVKEGFAGLDEMEFWDESLVREAP
jgi:hypothetical protein